MIAKAIFHEDGEITIQAGGHCARFEYINEVVEIYWEYIVEGTDDEDIARFYDYFEEGVYQILDTDLVLDVSDLDTNPVVCKNDHAKVFLEKISEKYQNENSDMVGSGWWVIDRKNPFLRRWYEDKKSALDDPGIVDETYKMEEC